MSTKIENSSEISDIKATPIETTNDNAAEKLKAAAKTRIKKSVAKVDAKQELSEPVFSVTVEPKVSVLFCASEVAPFAASGGLADVAGSLPIALNEKGCDVRVILPLYEKVNQQWRDRMEFLSYFFVPLGWRNLYCGLFKLEDRGVTYYFIDNEYYFKRPALYGHYDDGERFAFFSKAILESLDKIDFYPQIIHCNDWQTALVPIYLREYRNRDKFAGIKTLFTIHNIQFQGMYDGYILGDLFGLPNEDLPLMHWGDCINLMKGAIEVADKVNTVSPTYAKEILDPWYSFGLDPLLVQKQYKLSGILNGIDYVTYNPETDPNIPATFSKTDLSGKEICKKELLKEFNLPDDGRPLVAMICRLTQQKGVDLVERVLDYMLVHGMQFILLGTGDKIYEDKFREFAWRNPESCSVKIDFLPALSKRMYAGADLFLMPSKTEPCGLAQMMALRYGTLPIVRKTGGLADSVQDCGDGEGVGFTFQNYDAYDMLDACMRAKDLYYDKDQWVQVQHRAMNCDFSWNTAADSYLSLYEEMKTLW
ncbi:MAG: glycogen synthase GlgA [Oscillospiraceae bacterium]|nr:glycogen synthase GlgA [Oscillospiraceae bacterium]